jgi:ornithine carbamoyltransferase
MHVSVGCPVGYEPDAGILAKARELSPATRVEVLHDPHEAARGADVLYTDVWVSMGMEAEKEQREAIFRPYQVNRALVEAASKDPIVMHCLPAHRGLEITDDVLDGPRSVVWDQAENRLHTQKALLVDLLGPRNRRR